MRTTSELPITVSWKLSHQTVPILRPTMQISTSQWMETSRLRPSSVCAKFLLEYQAIRRRRGEQLDLPTEYLAPECQSIPACATGRAIRWARTPSSHIPHPFHHCQSSVPTRAYGSGCITLFHFLALQHVVINFNRERCYLALGLTGAGTAEVIHSTPVVIGRRN